MIIRFLYTLLLLLAAPFLFFGLYRTKKGKPAVGGRWKEHFGFSPPLDGDQPIWIHAVSVGEVVASIPLIRSLKKQDPNLLVLLTTTTATGAKQAEALSDLVEHRYMPVDFNSAVKRFIKRFKPSQLLIIETELWPNTLSQVHKASIPVTIINARLSEKSYQNYCKVLPLFKTMIPSLTQLLCQYDTDAKRFANLGIPPDRIYVTGSIKFDITINEEVQSNGEQLRHALGSQRPVWIAASTHQGEDEIVLAAHSSLLQAYPNALLILVPRHPERFESVYQLCRSSFNTNRRTANAECDENTQVYLADTMGEMLTLIAAADLCFMGGSLLGDKVGGHNMLEPAALAKPIITGASFFNFTDITNQLLSAGACKIVNSKDELAAELNTLLLDKEASQQKGLAAKRVVDKNRGALDKTLGYLGNSNRY
ncbi:lipid IV(A) 3-deoxy-D-manno-octulosonic acid transferase [Vibrio sp. 404]|uniref:3-deoxy-D-manno-octulosonic acid transferase n=1 Tax=Vibrio marinisediminis TaxID=2758441 RepID=A0A7W2IU37_9VIBR|nr:lipid IV(A) 3-deoxy-D-manno-octulosonic acid transferase [Vibrio marinisediminis]MBA5762818.1 lipid IV(A) 3-deoxy-D-manno-octulosonic acid transferase [Vibrio marinisediminis]